MLTISTIGRDNFALDFYVPKYMSSVNPHYTFKYSQPEAYRFSHDSVFLSRRVFEAEGTRLESARVLDLCAGCGIVGLDLMFHARAAGIAIGLVDFLEVQEIYAKYFEQNAREFPRARFINGNYRDFQGEYDLIVANPPYFYSGQGKLSPSEFKNRCRFFLDASAAELSDALQRLLVPGGRAYILMRKRIPLPPSLEIEHLEPVRGTPLLRFEKRIF